MPTELPYAADAEDSLSYDELQVQPHPLDDFVRSSDTPPLGAPSPISEGGIAVTHNSADKVQLRLGFDQESKKRAPSRRRRHFTRYSPRSEEHTSELQSPYHIA